jgi:circadian clock protein KaiC
MSLRLIDLFKAKTITAMFSSLTYGNIETATTDVDISSLIDSWLLLYNRENNGEHNRQLYLLKSRGMAHSNQVREFILSSEGISLRDVYVGPEGLLTGSARIAQEAREQARKLERRQEIERRRREFGRRRRQIEAEVEELQARLASEKAEIDYLASEELDRDNQIATHRLAMARSRRADGVGEDEQTGTFRDTDAFRFGKQRP